MPSPWPATSSADRPAVLLVGLSVRALAAAARRAVLRPLAADLFLDRDTRRLAWRCRQVTGSIAAGLDEESLISCLDTLVTEVATPPIGLIYGAGLEDRPGLLATLDRRYGLIGNGPLEIARIKTPARFFALLDRLSIPHPEVTLTPPATGRGWLIKRGAASGGAHIAPLTDALPAACGHYYQRRVRGRAVSALFLANGRRARVLGFSEQWPAPAGPRTPFRFGGLAQPAGLDPRLAADMAAVVERLAVETGLRGLNSADFLVRRQSFDLLEINPRIGASLDVFDRAPDAPLIALHRRAAAGDLSDTWSAPRRASASAVVYADRRLAVPQGFRWPRWSADRPSPGSVTERGAPLCSVFASGGSSAVARAYVEKRARQILDAMARPADRRRAKPQPQAMAP